MIEGADGVFTMTKFESWYVGHIHLVRWFAPAAAFVLGACWLAFCRPRPAPLPVAEAHSIDSLQITRPLFTAAIDSMTRRETVYVAASRHAARAATIARAEADSLKAVADALQAAALAQGDTASRWYAVAIARGREADSLRVSNDSLASALAEREAARLQADARAASALARTAALENLNARLAHDVQHAGECRLLPFVRCPSRRASAVVGALAGAALTVYATR